MEISYRFELCSGHRLQKHHKCSNLHGHSYAYDIRLSSRALEDGMVLDFGVLKELVGIWLMNNFDHAMILEATDPMLVILRETGVKLSVLSGPPTAEFLASTVYNVTKDLLKLHGHDMVQVVSVTCFEGPRSSATYSGGEIVNVASEV